MKNMVRLSESTLKLVQAQVIFRHGARTPLHYIRSPIADILWSKETTADVPETMIKFKHVDLFSREVVDEDTFDLNYRKIKLPGGECIGMLTSIGQLDMFNIGARLRNDYVIPGLLLSNPLKKSEFNCRSTRVGRNIKSMRSLIAGLSGNSEYSKPIEISSMSFETDFLFPNLKMCALSEKYFNEGSDEIKKCNRILKFKDKIRSVLKVDQLVDALQDNEAPESGDCQVYYVRDDYIARQHNKFHIPPKLEPLFDEMDTHSATELLCELMGKKSEWMSNLHIIIGPVLHLLLTNMFNHTEIAPLQLIAGHDSTIMPILLALDCFDGKWPPFGADISLELYSNTETSDTASSGKRLSSLFPNSTIDWPDDFMKNCWLRVKYIGQPVPLARLWGLESHLLIPGSDQYVPLAVLVDRWSELAICKEDHAVLCGKEV